MMKKITQPEIIKAFFHKNPDRDIEHPEVVDWATKEYEKKTGKVFRDPDRQIRRLYDQKFLIKVATGVYRYNPQNTDFKKPENFSPKQKREILKRDGYRCVLCGKSKRDGIELHVDHIKPQSLDGKATIENGQTLCATHNLKKKNYNQTETGKKMFIHLYKTAKTIDDSETMNFCSQILDVFEKNGVNGHIKWEK